ncbi:MAG TPA: DUF3592 domain-containing protein [Blastocatellia bacterium]|nr:DUF3592 domain-containing protein [Blastocatellia bacterium]
MATWLTRAINRILRRQTEDQYYAWLLQYGRIIEGEIIDLQRDGSEVRIFYTYNISNVQYESSQTLRPEQLNGSYQYQPGLPVTVRFDPRYPGRSVVQ